LHCKEGGGMNLFRRGEKKGRSFFRERSAISEVSTRRFNNSESNPRLAKISELYHALSIAAQAKEKENKK